MQRELISINGREYFLAQGIAAEDIMSQIVAAVRSGGDFVRVVLVGNRALQILVSPGIHLLLDSVEVPEDIRDDGDEEFPFDPDLFG